MSFQRRAAMDLGRRDHTRWLGVHRAGASADPLALTGTPVVLLAGQSNAVGSGDVEASYTPRAGVDYTADVAAVRYWLGKSDADAVAAWNDLAPGATTIGCEMMIGRDLYAEHGLADLHIVKYALGATILGDSTPALSWRVDYAAAEWSKCKATMAAALAAAPSDAKVHHVVWIHGESDSQNSTDASNYQTNFTNLIAASRAEWGPQVRWHIVRLHRAAYLSAGAVNMSKQRQIRAAQVAVCDADPLAFLVDVDSAPMGTDNHHYNAPGYISVGQLCAESVAQAHGLIAAQGDPVATPLLDWDAGTFARASAKTLWDGMTLSRFASGAIVKDASGYVDIEGQRTNEVARCYDITGASWTNGTATRSYVADTQIDGTSGNVSKVVAISAQYGPYFARSVGPSVAVMSHWTKAVAGSEDFNYRSRTSGTTHVKIGIRDVANAAWARAEGQWTPTGTESAGVIVVELSNAQPVLGDHSLAGLSVWVSGIQLELAADSASSLIETSGAVATRQADSLSYASGAVPSVMRTGAWSFGLTVPWAWDQLTYDRTLFAWGTGATDRIWYDASTHKITVTQGGVDVALSKELVFRPGARLTVSVDAAAGTVTVRGAHTGNGTGPTGTPWTMPSASLQVGARSDLTEAAFARLGEPY